MGGALEQDDAPDRLPEPLSKDQLRRHFTVRAPDLEEVALRRGTAKKLGFAVQLCTLRWQGFFLRGLGEVPGAVLDTLAAQLGVLSIGLGAYPGEEKTRRIHLERIRTHLGFVRCGEDERANLLAFLGQEARVIPRTELLRKAAHAWLLNHKIVRPGRTTLRDLIAHAREAALNESFTLLTRDLTVEQEAQLDELLAAAREEPEGSPWPRSPLERLKQLPRKESAETILFLLSRLRTVLELGFAAWPSLDDLHPNLRRYLALWGYRYDAYNLRRFAEPKRRAVLLCFLSLVVAETADGVVEALDKVMNNIHAKARKRRQEVLRASEEARRRAVEVVETVGSLALSDEVPDSELRRAIFERFPREDLGRLVEGSRLLREGTTARTTASPPGRGSSRGASRRRCWPSCPWRGRTVRDWEKRSPSCVSSTQRANASSGRACRWGGSRPNGRVA